MHSPNLDQLSRRWHRAPRRWGHPLHSLCSYFAMFPPQVPHVFIRWLTEPGDVVYDPFSGRGTAPMEACRLGRLGMGSDANPLAYILTAAKVDPPSLCEATARIRELRGACVPGRQGDAPDDIRMLYAPEVLGQLLWLRGALSERRRTDRFLMATLLGLMHANYKPGSPARGLSISMPNTFSMSPAYVRGYIDEHGLEPPQVDVFDMLEAKVMRMHLPAKDRARGAAWRQDVREPVPVKLSTDPARLLFTSPPYLGVISYGKYNWVRLWMLGENPKEVDSRLVATGSLSRYVAFMRDALTSLQAAVRDDGYLCLMIGDVRERSTGEVTNLAEEVWQQAAADLGWHRVGIIADRLPTEHKVSRIWKNTPGRATKTDRILVLARRKASSKQLPPLERIRWTPPTAWA